MATAIVWDDDPPVEPLPEQPKQTLLNPGPKLSSEAYRAMYLGTVDTGEIITELNKRGYYVQPATVGIPTVTTVAPYTTTISSGTFTMPSMGGLSSASCEYYSQLMQNVATLGRSTTGK